MNSAKLKVVVVFTILKDKFYPNRSLGDVDMNTFATVHSLKIGCIALDNCIFGSISIVWMHSFPAFSITSTLQRALSLALAIFNNIEIVCNLHLVGPEREGEWGKWREEKQRGTINMRWVCMYLSRISMCCWLKNLYYIYKYIYYVFWHIFKSLFNIFIRSSTSQSI